MAPNPFERDDKQDKCEIFGCWPFRRRLRSNNSSSTRSSRVNHNSNNLLVPHHELHEESRVPRLVNIRRESSPLLMACWQQNWSEVLLNITIGDQIYHRSHNTGRTALHLTTMPGSRCPPHVLSAVLQANPFAVVTEDYHQYGGTPLHFCCGSKLREQPLVVKEMVDVALRVHAQHGEDCQVRLSYWSPLYQAAKWAAPPATLQILVQASRTQPWIGPWTGAESWTREPEIRRASLEPARDSPLRALWRRQIPKRLISIHGLPVDLLCQVTLDYYAAANPFEFWLKHPTISNNLELSHWCKVLVLLHDQSPLVDQLLHTAVSLHACIPPLVRLLTVLWPEQVLQPVHQYLPLHTAVARYLAASTESCRHEAAEVIEILAQSQPQTLSVPDPTTGYPPALQAAPQASVDLIYTLLRPVPTLVPVRGYNKAMHASWMAQSQRVWEILPDV